MFLVKRNQFTVVRKRNGRINRISAAQPMVSCNLQSPLGNFVI